MPEGLLQYLMVADSALIHLALALVLGSMASQWWLEDDQTHWRTPVIAQAFKLRVLGFGLGLPSLLAALWFEAAAMAELPLLQAQPALGTLLMQTHFGHAGMLGLAAWLLAATLLLAKPAQAFVKLRFGLALAALVVFVATRSVVSHAGGQGDATIDVAVDWLHLVLVCLWVGMVAAGACIALPRGSAPRSDRNAAVRWVSSLSTTATVVIVGITATGAFKVWRGLGAIASLDAYVGSDYGHALAIKLVLVTVAAILGGINRFAVLPRIFEDLAASSTEEDSRWRRKLLNILRAEMLILLMVLFAAATLSNIAPPGAT